MPSNITKEKLLSVFPGANATSLGIDKLIAVLNTSIPKILGNDNLTNKRRVAAFIAQTGHESASFTAFKENLNYSAPSLVRVFHKYFPDDATAIAYARQPEKIANRVYANRMGNRDEASGDGWKNRGRGIIQTTGADNYSACGKFLGLDLVNHPELLEQLPGAVDSGIWYWTVNNLNKFADVEDMKGLTKAINGGFIGLDERINNYNKFKVGY